MKTETAKRLEDEYPYFWQHNLVDMPDAWVSALIDLWSRLDALNSLHPARDRPLIWVGLKYLVYPGGVIAFAAPAITSKKWTQEHALTLIYALDEFSERVRETCEECGCRAGFLHKARLGLGIKDRILCEDCGLKWSEAGDDA
ncbi:hypothetical protein ABIA16_003529 [Sinorhizobium fredii]